MARNGYIMDLKEDRALVILSGGQDSSTCLFWAIDKFGADNVETVTFDYGQKHKIELESAEKICKLADTDYDLVEFPHILRSYSPLVNSSIDLEKHDQVAEFEQGVQATFVPGRNILFLTVAANIAMSKGCNKLVTGIGQEDFGGYYDCRNDFVEAMQLAINQGMFGHSGQDNLLEGKAQNKLEILTPLMFLNKKEIAEMAKSLGKDCLEALAYSHTCYDGAYPPCGKCHSCHLRSRGFEEAGFEDPLISRANKAHA